MEEVFKVTAAGVVCLDDSRWSAAALGGGPGWGGPMAEAANSISNSGG